MQDPSSQVEAGLQSQVPGSTQEIGNPVVFLKKDPMIFSRSEWLDLPSGSAQRDAIFELRRKSYDPEKAAQAQRLFTEGYTDPLTEIDHIVFNAAGRIMDSLDGAVSEQDRATLSRHLNLENISLEEAISAFQQEGAHRRRGNFWPTRHSIGGYELNRQIANEIENQVAQDIERDEIRLGYLQEMAITLEDRGIPMIASDQRELERLTEDKQEKERLINQRWDQARLSGTSKTILH